MRSAALRDRLRRLKGAESPTGDHRSDIADAACEWTRSRRWPHRSVRKREAIGGHHEGWDREAMHRGTTGAAAAAAMGRIICSSRAEDPADDRPAQAPVVTVTTAPARTGGNPVPAAASCGRGGRRLLGPPMGQHEGAHMRLVHRGTSGPNPTSSFDPVDDAGDAIGFPQVRHRASCRWRQQITSSTTRSPSPTAGAPTVRRSSRSQLTIPRRRQSPVWPHRCPTRGRLDRLCSSDIL